MPAECCGLLLGRGDEVVHAVRARNIAPEPTRRFLVDPADHFAALRRGRAAGLSILGAYHSHPRGAAVPSETDREDALADESFIHVILDPSRGTLAAYCMREGNFAALELVRVP